jgi:hypothetical protein
MNAEYKDGKILNFKPVDDQEDIRNITGQDDVMQWDAQEQRYRVIPEHDCGYQQIKDEFTQVILQIEEEDDGMNANEPDGLAQGWIEALRFAITIINTKMKEEA